MRLAVEPLEPRDLPDATAVLAGGTLAVVGGPGKEAIDVALDPAAAQIVVTDHGREVGRFDSAAVERITLQGGPDDNILRIEPEVTQPAAILGGGGDDLLIAGGGPTTLQGGPGRNKLIAGPGNDALLGGPGTDLLRAGAGADLIDGGPGTNVVRGLAAGDTLVPRPGDEVADTTLAAVAQDLADPAADAPLLSTGDVQALLNRAAAATASTDAIIAVVDRNGRILGVRVESGVAPEVQTSPATLTFAVDGAVALARTGAFFANNQAPLTSRTIQFISQSTITQREVMSSPDLLDPDSPLYGPGFVAPIGVGGHFPPGIAETPQVDLFEIEHTNRDGTLHPDGSGGVVALPERFNIDPAFVPPGQTLFPPDSYGFVSGLMPRAQNRGIGTLPGGVPIYKDGNLVGGIGVFFPGKTGYASEENSSLSTYFDPTKPDRSLEAEYIAFAAVGGAPGIGFPIGDLPEAPLPAGIAGLPLTPDLMRIDLVGVTLDVVGPGGIEGPSKLVAYGQTLGLGSAGDGHDLPVDATGDTLLAGRPVPEGWLVTPHDGVDVSAADVEAVVTHGIAQALRTRAAIRLPQDSTTRMVFAVTDRTGAVLGLFRMPDATVFSIDVAVAKARNVAYYASPTALQPADELPAVPPGVAFTNRTFRYLAEPRFPEGIDGAPPGPFSQLNDGGADPLTGLQVGPPLPGSAFTSVLGHDSFRPETNFRDPRNPLNQNGIVFFPGSAPLYTEGRGAGGLVGGLGVSGDGVDQDDVVTFAATQGFFVPPFVPRADQFLFGNVRLPYQKFNRQPLEPS
jgi:uncharacterized protein GlcG (DUF336 family)